MSTRFRNKQLQQRKRVIEQIEQLHPHRMLNYLIITASSFVFIYFLISFLQFSQFDFSLPKPNHFPKFFAVSTVLIIASLVFSTRIMDLYRSDKIKNLRLLLSRLLIIGLLFIITQSLAWLELLNMELAIPIQKYQSYLFIFSGIHSLHMAAGVVILGLLFYRISSVEGDLVKSVVYLTNPYDKIKLDIFSTLWHFTLISWMLIYAFFVIVF